MKTVKIDVTAQVLQKLMDMGVKTSDAIDGIYKPLIVEVDFIELEGEETGKLSFYTINAYRGEGPF